MVTVADAMRVLKKRNKRAGESLPTESFGLENLNFLS